MQLIYMKLPCKYLNSDGRSKSGLLVRKTAIVLYQHTKPLAKFGMFWYEFNIKFNELVNNLLSE